MKKKTMLFICVLLLLSLTGCDASVNRSQTVGEGEHSAGLTSVNGSIRIGARSTVDGGCRTVNGRIEVGDGARVKDLDTVNGRITVGAGVEVDGDAEAVNGSVACGAGSRLRGKVSTVNGRIELRNTVIGEDVITVNGDVLLLEKSVVRGNIVIKGRRGFFSGDHHRLEIRIEGESVVEGGIDVRDPDREVTVYISKDARVQGEIRNAKVTRE